jgi:peptide/nickel transport system permease protein
MSRFLLRRIGFLVLTILLTSVLIFIVTRLLPGDVARVILGREAGEEAVLNLRQELGLNDAAPVQYLRWLVKFAIGDWGISYSTKSEIRPLVMERLHNSLMLAMLTLMVAVPLAVGWGVFSGSVTDACLTSSDCHPGFIGLYRPHDARRSD